MFLPIRVRSIYSIGNSVLRMTDIAKKSKEYGYSHCCLCDLRNVSGAYDFFKACKKEGVIPIIGCEFTVYNNEVEYQVICLAKNKNGWYKLCKLVSSSNKPENYISIPRLNYKQISPDNDLIFIDVLGSNLPVFAHLDNTDSYSDFQLVHCMAKGIVLSQLGEVDKEPFIKLNLDNELYNNIINSVVEYDLENSPVLPKCYNDGDENQILRNFCKDGWRKKKQNIWNEKLYGDRVREELDIILEYDLAGYFLIIKDVMDYARNNGWLCIARGSVGGSMVAYLLGISIVDPIKYDLVFSRFFNKGRKGSLPDIDIDVQSEHREDLIKYLRFKYGKESVAQIVTFARLVGSGALKEVLRIHQACDFMTSNRITKNIPKEAKVEANMQDDNETSLILWCLKKMPMIFEEYCQFVNDEYVGDFAEYFKQAVRIEGIIKSTGKHAAGVLISNKNLEEDFPMMKDHDSDNLIAAMEFTTAESLGKVKIDCLGVSALTKLAGVNKLLKYGKIGEEINE